MLTICIRKIKVEFMSGLGAICIRKNEVEFTLGANIIDYSHPGANSIVYTSIL